MRYLAELKEDDHVLEHYLCKQKQSLKTRSGKTYLSLRLQDKTGVIDAKVWEMHNDIQSFEENDMIKIDGIALMYQNEIQIKIIKIRKSLDGEYTPLDYIPCTEKDIESLYAQVIEYIRAIGQPMLRQLMENIFINNETVADAFKTHTAAKHLHHSYMGGLLEHTLSVTQVCDFFCGHYKTLNRDLLITTAILHDIGKIYELSRLPNNDYTDDGQLLGHIVMGAEMLTAEAARIPCFPHDLLSLVKHSILAHHGEYEFGSPKLPSTMEAFVLHMADNMDAKMDVYREAVEKETSPGRPWTQGFNKMLGRYVRSSTYNG
jgi:3'-5' exoribonuclease